MSETERMACIGNMIRNLPALRSMLHLSQSDLAGKLGVSRQQIVAVENGKRQLTWTAFLALILIFRENQETKILLELFEIYTEEVRKTIRCD